VSLLEHNLNQQISLFIIFVLLTLHATSALTKVLVHLRLNLTQPWAFHLIAISLKVYLPPCA